MPGYSNIDDKDRVLNEWYQLFKIKNQSLSQEEYDQWKNFIKLGLFFFQKNYSKNICFQEFLKHNFIFNETTNFNISSALQKLSLSLDCIRLVFVNGQFSSKFSDKDISPWLLTLNCNYNCYHKYKASNISPQSMFLFLTQCLSDFVISIKLPDNTITKKPLYLLYLSIGSNIKNQLITTHYCNNINLGKNTHTCIIEHFVSANSYGNFVGDQMFLSVGKQSNLNHIKLIFENQLSYHTSHQNINQKELSNVNDNIFIIAGPKFTYHQVHSQINHEQTSLFLNSLILLSNNDISDIQSYIEHNNNNYSVSRQLHKIIADDNSTGIFNGLIKVNNTSVNTNGKMINNNLLLHKSASIYSKPNLEIYSDKVQCSHGVTIGQIDSQCTFYLNTRGIPTKDALIMLIRAFSSEITEKIENRLLKQNIIKRINTSLIRNAIT